MKANKKMNQVIEKRLNFLNQNPKIKEEFFSMDTTDKIWSIGQKHGFSDEQISAMAKDVGLVLLKELPLIEFEKKYPRLINEIKEQIIKDLISAPRKLEIKSSIQELPAPKEKEIHEELKEHGIHATVPDSTIY